MSPDVAIQAPYLPKLWRWNMTNCDFWSLFFLSTYTQLEVKSTMETLPTELHAYICQIGCTIDQGSAIRRLHRVSKYYNEVTKPYLLRNVSAVGIHQCLTLLERLESTPTHMRKIDHLFLSDSPSSPPLSNAPKRLSDDETRSIVRIITIAAPSLKTFTLIATSPFSSTALIARIFRTSFPLLQTLAISGFYPVPSSPGRFPSLTTLHLDGNRNPSGLLQPCGLEEACPNLRELRVTGLRAAGYFVVELEEALTGREVENETADFGLPVKLPPRLRHVTIQAGPEPVVSSPIDNAAAKDRVLMRRLESLKKKSTSNQSGVNLSILERSTAWISVDDHKTAWVQGIIDIHVA